MLIVTGPPGAGKTATARLVASRWDRSAHIESDHFFRFIESGYIEPWKPESHEHMTLPTWVSSSVTWSRSIANRLQRSPTSIAQRVREGDLTA